MRESAMSIPNIRTYIERQCLIMMNISCNSGYQRSDISNNMNDISIKYYSSH